MDVCRSDTGFRAARSARHARARPPARHGASALSNAAHVRGRDCRRVARPRPPPAARPMRRPPASRCRTRGRARGRRAGGRVDRAQSHERRNEAAAAEIEVEARVAHVRSGGRRGLEAERRIPAAQTSAGPGARRAARALRVDARTGSRLRPTARRRACRLRKSRRAAPDEAVDRPARAAADRERARDRWPASPARARARLPGQIDWTTDRSRPRRGPAHVAASQPASGRRTRTSRCRRSESAGPSAGSVK